MAEGSACPCVESESGSAMLEESARYVASAAADIGNERGLCPEGMKHLLASVAARLLEGPDVESLGRLLVERGAALAEMHRHTPVDRSNLN
jgi:hypothetical protein